MQVSIIIICNNWDHYLEEALRKLDLMTGNIEKVVLTDGSTPNVATIVNTHANYKLVSVLESKNNIERMNLAVKATLGEAFCFLGVDDFLAPYYGELAADILETNPDIDIVGCDIERFEDEQGVWKNGGLGDGLKQSNHMFFSSFIRRELFDKLGGFDEDIPQAVLEDWDFWVRAHHVAKAKAHIIPAPLFKYRCHPKQISKTTVPAHGAELYNYLQSKWSQYV